LFDGEYIARGDSKKIIPNKDDEFEWWRKQAIKFKHDSRDSKRFVFGKKNKIFSIPSTESFR
jgi:hypothetical protein